MKRRSIVDCFSKPVIPVMWDPSPDLALIGEASSAFVQGGAINELPDIIGHFQQIPQVSLFVHIDLVSGLENNESGLAYLAGLPGIRGIVTVHHHLVRPAHRLGLQSIVRLFLTDSRAVDRGLAIVDKSHADAIELLPAVAAVQVAPHFKKCSVPRIAGGLCQTEQDIQDCVNSGCEAATSTRPELWQMNRR